MQTIYKYPLVITDHQYVDMPKGAEILSVAKQHGDLWMWAKVDPSQPIEPRRIVIHGTGHPLSEEAQTGRFIGAALMHNDALVLHVFEAAR